MLSFEEMKMSFHLGIKINENSQEIIFGWHGNWLVKMPKFKFCYNHGKVSLEMTIRDYLSWTLWHYGVQEDTEVKQPYFNVQIYWNECQKK